MILLKKLTKKLLESDNFDAVYDEMQSVNKIKEILYSKILIISF